MNEKRYQKRLDFQQNIITRQSKQIENLKSQIVELKLECQEKDKIIDSVEHLRKELADNVNEIKQKKNEYQTLIKELKTMKNIINEEVYNGKWWLIRFLLK